VLASVIARISTLFKDFDEYRLIHIKRDSNPLADRWAKVGAGLNEGLIIVNGDLIIVNGDHSSHSIP